VNGLLDALQPQALHGRDQVVCHVWSGGVVKPLTGDRLARGSAAYAAALQAAGVGRDEVVLIALPHSEALLYSFFGAMTAGCVPSFIPPPTPKQDPALYWSSHRQLFERLGSGAIVSWRDNVDDLRRCLRGLPIQVFLSEDIDIDRENAPALPALARATSDVACLQHSSGTTGLKKGVALTFDAIDQQIDAYAAAIGLGATDCIVSWLPLYHDMGLIACLLLPFVRRTPIVWLDPFEWVARPAMLFDAIAAHRGTLAWLPNFAFHHLARTVADDARVDLSGMRAFINCSEPCKAETFDLFASRFADWGVRPDQLQVCYAMAEAVFAVTQTAMNSTPLRFHLQGQTLLSVGSPVRDWQVRVIDRDGNPVPEGTIGEIAMTGGSLFAGYHKQPEETARKFRDGWYLTGDLGCQHAGDLFITGRVDDLIIVHGKNIYAHDVEFAMNQVPGVKAGRAVAIGLFVPEAGTQDLLLIAESTEPADRHLALGRAIKAAVVQLLGLAPRAVRIVEPGWLVKTTSGKISRAENLRKHLAGQQPVTS